MTREECLDEACRLNDHAGRLILRGRYQEAARALNEAAIWACSEAGQQVLYARAAETAAMAAERSS